MWQFWKRTSQHTYAVAGDAQAIFKLQCKFGQTDIIVGQGIIAIVLDAVKEFGAPVAVKVDASGRQTAIVRVASPDGGFIVLAATKSEKGEPLNVGDLVMWVPREWVKDVAATSKDTRFGWVGFIRAKVKPEVPLASGNSWNFTCRYD